MDDNIRNGQTRRFNKDLCDNIAIIIVFIIGFIGGFLIRILRSDIEPAFSAAGISLGISAFVYKFLGGISNDTFIKLKEYKMSGAIAAFVIIFLLFNNILVEQRKWIPKEKLILSFYKNDDSITQNISVYLKQKKINSKNGDFELDFKDIEGAKGRINIDYEPPEETGQKLKKFLVDYRPYVPEISLNLNFLDKIEKTGLSSKNVILTLFPYAGTEAIYDPNLIVKNDKQREVSMDKKGDFNLPPEFFLEGNGFINIVRKEIKEEEFGKQITKENLQKKECLQIKHIQYKYNPPQIIIHVENFNH
jgi:hypothetical protein